jgi:hypothetical protein
MKPKAINYNGEERRKGWQRHKLMAKKWKEKRKKSDNVVSGKEIYGNHQCL